MNDAPVSILSVEGAKEVAVELNSLSKSHNMAGWRIGALCGAKQVIDDVLRFKSNMDSGMFLPLQLAAAKALQLGKDWHLQLNETYGERKKLVMELLNAINCKAAPGQAGLFVWAKVPVAYKDGYALSDELLYETNVFITPGGIFGSAGEQYIRISLCTTEEKLNMAIKRVQKIKA